MLTPHGGAGAAWLCPGSVDESAASENFVSGAGLPCEVTALKCCGVASWRFAEVGDVGGDVARELGGLDVSLVGAR